MSGSSKKKVYVSGLLAEKFAGLYMNARGYRIFERRYKTPGGEIDLIAKRGRHVAFVEVKYRQELDVAAYSVSDYQKKRIVNAARYWLASHGGDLDQTLSFDVILLAPFALPRYIRSAFDEM